MTVIYTVQDGFEFEFAQEYTTELLVNGVNKNDLTFEETSFCEDIENINNRLKLKITDVKVEGFGDEDDYWYLRDNIEVELEVENDDNDWELKNIEIEWELYSTNGEKIDDGSVNDFNLKDGDTETITFNFELDSDLEEFDGEDAVLYVRATAEINSDDSHDGEDTCNWLNKQVEIRTENFVIADNIKINNELAKTDEYNQLTCEKEVTVTFETWNIGDSDEEDLYIEVYSDKLGIYEKFEISSLDAYESSEAFELTFTVPENLEKGKYNLEFEVYDEDGDIYENKEDDKSSVIIIFENKNSCLVVKPYITANLDTEAKAGKDMTIKVSVRNDDVQSRTFSISAQGYESWAKLKEVSTESFIVESGRIQDLSLTLEIKDGIEGDKTFNLNVYSDGKLISTQPVAVTVEAKEGIQDLLDGINWKVVGIVLVNLALLVAIIIVVRKILKKN
jgi:hypothetical protein